MGKDRWMNGEREGRGGMKMLVNGPVRQKAVEAKQSKTKIKQKSEEQWKKWLGKR